MSQKLKLFILLAIVTTTRAIAQQPPELRQQDVLQILRLAASHHSTTGERYRDGLLALWSIHPQKTWLDQANLLSGQDVPDSTGEHRIYTLVHHLSTLPLTDRRRPGYLQEYKDFIASKHHADPIALIYGLAWGIRNGYLDKKQYYPIVASGFTSIAQHPLENYDLGSFLLAGSEVYTISTPPEANYDESKIPPYTEPQLDLSTVKTWTSVQRPAIKKLFEENVYGRIPGDVSPTSYAQDPWDSTALGGLAIRKLIAISFPPAHYPRLEMMLYLPKNAKDKVPVFVGYSFTSNAETETSSEWPLKEIISRGYGVAVAWYWDFEPDRVDGWQTGIRTRLAAQLHIQPWEWSAISTWAWGLCRMADALSYVKQVDSKKLIAIGHSRLGKTALWAAANDQRFAMVISNESGEGGAALGKRNYGETIAFINYYFPWWFSPKYKQFGSDPATMPVDQHQLLTLIAPRPLYIASAVGDQWSDPKGEFLSAKLAQPAWHLYGKKGLETDSMPPPEHPVGENIRYHIRNGKHDLTLYDWQEYMNFADRQFARKFTSGPSGH